MSLRIRFVTAALAGAMAVAGTGSALAASPAPTASASPRPQLGMGVGASDIILGPDQRSGSIATTNAGDLEETFSISVNDFTVDSAGRRVPSAGPTEHGAAQWISVSPTAATVKPSQSTDFTFTVEIPDGAAPGDHYAEFVVAGTLSDAAWAKRQRELGDVSTSMRSRVEFPVTVIVRVPGEVKNDLKVSDGTGGFLSPFFNSWGSDIEFAPRIVNDGNVAAIWMPAAGTTAAPESVVPSLRLVNKLGFLGGDALLYLQNKDGTPSTVIVLPGTSKTLSLALKDPPLIGMYDYTFTLPGSDPVAAASGVGDGRPTVTVTGSVTVVNYEKVALWIVLPIVVVLLLIALLLFWRWRRRRNARRAVEAKDREREQMRAEVQQEEAAKREAALQAAVTAEEARQAALERNEQP